MSRVTLFILILPVYALASAPSEHKYTAKELKEIKPPLVAQQFTLKPKAGSPKSWTPPMQRPPQMVQSPIMAYRTLSHGSTQAFTGPEKIRLRKQLQIPFPEITISFEELK